MPDKILLQDRDNGFSSSLHQAIGEEYEIVCTGDDAPILEAMSAANPDLIILCAEDADDFDYSVCQQVREMTNAPIIILAKNGEESRIVRGLEAGADDYLAWPFHNREIVARLRAHLRRARLEETAGDKPKWTLAQSPTRFGELKIDLNSQCVSRNGKTMPLSRQESRLLGTMLANIGQVLSREQLLIKAWGDEYTGYERTVDAHIWSIRQKIETDPTNPRHLLTVRGFGYKFEPAVTA